MENKIMVQQLSLLFSNITTTNNNNNNKRIHNTFPSYYKQDKIKKDLKEWNTIKHIYRYQTLYKIYNKLFMLTYNNKLECLTYYIEDVDNFMYAVDESLTALPLKKRILCHIKLLRRVYKNDKKLKRSKDKKTITDSTTLFG